MPIPYGRQSIDDDDVAAVADVLRGDWLTQGPAVSEFEQAVQIACDVPYAVAYSSGTAALHGAAFASGIGGGDELLTSANTFAASANAGAYVGATPRFADIDPATWNVSAKTVAAAVTSKTRAVVPVHFAGLPSPVSEIRELVGADVTIIEDAAHAIGASTPEGPVGSCRHSDMAAFSFHPVKVITSGEGGMVTTRSEELYQRLIDFRTHGITKDPTRIAHPEDGWFMEQQSLGFNYRMSDIQAALGSSQLKKLGGFIDRRNEIAQRYREGLANLEAIELPPAAPGGSLHAYHLFVIRHRDGAAARKKLYDGLREREIFAQVHYIPVYKHPWYRDTYGYEDGMCREAESYYEGCLSLPCFAGLDDDELDQVITALRELTSE
jgi:UDP-4-amino-4,6-dideoxy-N-acetyl-beta-L-altrosamine transaminase